MTAPCRIVQCITPDCKQSYELVHVYGEPVEGAFYTWPQLRCGFCHMEPMVVKMEYPDAPPAE